MSKIELINGSCADQMVDVVVNAANRCLLAGGGICGVIFKKAGMTELTKACNKYKTPINDGDAVITPAFNMKNAKAIIHAVGPNFGNTPSAFKELFDAYYNSLITLMNNRYHSISFPLISAGIYGGLLDNPVAESTKQCCRAYKKFTLDYPMYDVDVKVCAFSANEMVDANKVFKNYSFFKENPFIFKGTLKKVRIVSNNVCYGPMPEPDVEVEQHLTINHEGRVWFSGYNFGNAGEKYKKARTNNFKIEKESADKLLNALATYFGNEYEEILATDSGDWVMELTNTEGNTYKFKGSLCADFDYEGTDLSDLVRDIVGMDDLYVFDGKCKH